jgi:hypothetical protein
MWALGLLRKRIDVAHVPNEAALETKTHSDLMALPTQCTISTSQHAVNQLSGIPVNSCPPADR